jgi:acetyltransferase-like isoleucine patch superfamily enzyme
LKEVIIGKKCYIGMVTIVLPGVTISDNAIIAAGSQLLPNPFPE